MKSAAGFAAVPATFAAGGAAAIALLRSAPHSIAPDRAQPLLVVTAWATYGTHALEILLATLVVALGALALTLHAFARRDERYASYDLHILIAVAAASAAACCAWPYIFSSDVYAYAAYGDLALRGRSPFVLAPAQIHDALLDGARWQWNGSFPPCVYGPGFAAFAAILVRGAQSASLDAAATLAAFRVCAVVAYLATIVCAHRALAAFGIAGDARTRALTLGALNPVVVWSVAEGHNDVYALLAVAAIVAFVPRGRQDRIVGYGLPLALCIKASAALALLPFALESQRGGRRKLGAVLVAAVAGTALAAAIDLPFLRPALERIAATGRYAPSVSLPQAIGPPAAVAAAAAFAAIALLALRNGHRSGVAWVGIAAFAALPNPYPWYGIVLVPLAVAGGRSRAGVGLYAVTICAALRYLPDAFGDMSPGMARIVSAIVVAPVVFALTGFVHDLRPVRDLRLAKEPSPP